MRWKANKTLQNGDKRTIKKFLWFPKCINGEYRFLETSFIEQVYYCDYSNYDCYEHERWKDIKWVEDKNTQIV